VTPNDALAELIGRVGASSDGAIFIDAFEIRGWPAETVAAMTAASLLSPASPAASIVCPGCEQQCVMPVHTGYSTTDRGEPFIVCDKRSDINRVAIEPDSLKRLHASGEAFAALLARLLKLRRTGADGSAKQWEVGAFKGRARSSHIVLVADGDLKLSLAGHFIPLEDVLTLSGDKFIPRTRVLVECVDKPAAGSGDAESSEQRRERISRRLEELKSQRRPDFLRIVAAEENLSVSRIKQIRSRQSGTVPEARKPKQ